VDVQVKHWTARHGTQFLCVSLGLVFTALLHAPMLEGGIPPQIQHLISPL